MARIVTSIVLVTAVVLGLAAGDARAQGQPEGQITIAFDATIAPTFIDPAVPRS